MGYICPIACGKKSTSLVLLTLLNPPAWSVGHLTGWMILGRESRCSPSPSLCSHEGITRSAGSACPRVVKQPPWENFRAAGALTGWLSLSDSF